MAWVAAEFSEAAKLRIKEAAQFEKRIRLEAFLGINVSLGVFEVRQITLSDFAHLEYTENALFVEGEEAGIADFVLFLWHMRTISEGRNAKQFAKWAASRLTPATQDEILGFIAAQLNDMPSGKSGPQTEIKQSTVADSSVAIATLVDQIANEYGWDEQKILKIPIARLLQYYQRIMKRNLGDKYAMTNRITQQARANEMKGMKDG